MRSRGLKWLASPKLAGGLIAALIVLNLLNVVLPQRTYQSAQVMAEFARRYPQIASATSLLGLDRVFSGWPILVVSVLLLASVLACTIRRLARHRSASKRPASPRAFRRTETPSSTQSGQVDMLEWAGSTLQARGWSVESTQNELAAWRGGSGFWGSMLLHVSLVVLIIGGAASVFTSFSGTLALTEGQTVIDDESAYETVDRMPQYGAPFTGATLGLDRMEFRYERGEIVSGVARMQAGLSGAIPKQVDVRVNYPLQIAGKSYLLRDTGYAATIVVESSGTVPVPSTVALARKTPYGWADQIESGALSGSSTDSATIEMTATPVPVPAGQVLPPEKYLIQDPRLEVAVRRGGRIVWQGVLAPGQKAILPDGGGVAFLGLSLWNIYLVRSDPARWIIYLGFWMSIVGALWRFAIPERRFVLRRGVAGWEYAESARPWGAHGPGSAATTLQLDEETL